jgi:4-amino-4-deoxy-L-arabinose transferase-like glycosyltransferase
MDNLLALLAVSAISAAILAVSILGTAMRLHRDGRDAVLCLAAGMVVSALAGWICIFAFVIGPALGVVSQFAMLAGLGWLFWRERAGLTDSDTVRHLLAPVAGALLVGVVLLMVTFSTTDASSYLSAAAQAYSHQLPNDNELPYLFAEMLRIGDLRSPMIGDWLSSDRPPLQTGMVLLYGLPFFADGSVLYYQVVSTLLQTYALLGAYILIRALGGGQAAAWAGAALLAASPVFLIHSVYVWPKLLPAGLLCVTAAVFFTARLEASRDRVSVGLLAGLAAGLAMGAHGATAFALVGFVVAALLLHRIPSFGYSVAGLATFAATYLPWTLYQRFVDPPGNRLLKWHVGGSIGVDDRGVIETLVESLRQLPAADWFYGRLTNLERIVSDPVARLIDPAKLAFASDPAALANHLRATDFFHWSSGLGVAAPFIFALPLALVFGATRSLAMATVAALVVWAVLMFAPGGAITHQGSLFPQIAAFSLIAYAAHRTDVRILMALAGLQLVSTGLIYFVFR